MRNMDFAKKSRVFDKHLQIAHLEDTFDSRNDSELGYNEFSLFQCSIVFIITVVVFENGKQTNATGPII